MGERMRGPCHGGRYPGYSAMPPFGVPGLLAQMMGGWGQQQQGPAPRRPHGEEWRTTLEMPHCFAASDITVRCEGRRLVITAVRQERSPAGSTKRQVQRRVEVPDGVDMDSVRTLWQSGRLVIVGKKTAREESKQSTVDPVHLQMQLESAFEELFGSIPQGAQPREESAQTSADAHPQTSHLPNLLQGFLGMDPSVLGDQAKSLVEDLHRSFTGHQDAAHKCPCKKEDAAKPESKEGETRTAEGDKEERAPEGEDRDHIPKEAESMVTGEQPECSEEDWVKAGHEDVEDITKYIVDSGRSEEPGTPAEEQPSERAGITQYIVEKGQDNLGDSHMEDTEKAGEKDLIDITAMVQDKEVTDGESPRPQLHQVRIDVSGYQPSEVVVANQGHKVKVSANHVAEMEGEGHEEYSFTRTLTLPQEADVERLDWQIEGDVMVLSVPLTQ